MEQQFILRLPEKFQHSDPKDFKLVKISKNQVKFYVKDKEYPGIICRIPTIIETQKSIDNKLYKIADLSTLVVIYEDVNFNFEEEIKKHESCGLTPPMQYVKERRFNLTNAIRAEDIEEIERKVAELLAEDSKAFKVETFTNEKESSDVDIELFAAEIENELPQPKDTSDKQLDYIMDDIMDYPKDTGISHKPMDICNMPKDNIISQSKSDSSKEKSTLLKNNIIKESNLKTTDTKEEKEAFDMDDISSFQPNKAASDDKKPFIATEIPLSNEFNLESKIPESDIKTETCAVPTDSRLLDLETKIREKEELLAKAVNPILKKRFEQALNDLKVEYENRRSELGLL